MRPDWSEDWQDAIIYAYGANGCPVIRRAMIEITGVTLYILIFIGQVIQVMVSTLRVIFMSKGQKRIAISLTFIAYGLYVIIFSSVLSNMYADPFKIVVYIAATALGIYCGMLIENRMAVGLSSMQVICSKQHVQTLGQALREHEFGVTIFDGHSVDGTERSMLFVQLRRKRVAEAVRLIHEIEPTAVVSQTEAQTISGGYIR